MVWPRIILDGIVLSVLFNVIVALLWLSVPNACSRMMPREIRTAAPKRDTREVRILVSVLYPLYFLIFIYMIISARLSGTTGFWNLFWTGYIEMFFINMGDFWFLDVWFREKFKDKLMIPGTENCKAWETKEWLTSLAIPEHGLGWTFIICPVVGLIVSSFSSLVF